jgi:hypothetical protein
MSLALSPGMTLAKIASVATSFRLNSGAAPPTTYANSVSSTIAQKLFAAGSFFTFVPATGTLSAPAFTGSVTGGGLAQWFSLCNDTGSALLATAPLLAPATIAATENNFLFSTGITLIERVSAPTLTSP